MWMLRSMLLPMTKSLPIWIILINDMCSKARAANDGLRLRGDPLAAGRMVLGEPTWGEQHSEIRTLESDPCWEATVQIGTRTEFVNHQQDLLALFKKVYMDCGSGRYNLACLANAPSSQQPSAYLRDCSLQQGPQPTMSGAVCLRAKAQVDQLQVTAPKYLKLSRLLHIAKKNCQIVPLECISFMDECVDVPHPKSCFYKCVTSRSIGHAIKLDEEEDDDDDDDTNGADDGLVGVTEIPGTPPPLVTGMPTITPANMMMR